MQMILVHNPSWIYNSEKSWLKVLFADLLWQKNITEWLIDLTNKLKQTGRAQPPLISSGSTTGASMGADKTKIYTSLHIRQHDTFGTRAQANLHFVDKIIIYIIDICSNNISRYLDCPTAEC